MNAIIANWDFRKVVFKKKTLISDSYIKESLLQGNLYRRTRLVTRSTCKVLWLHVVLVCPLVILVCPLVVSVCLHIVLVVLFVGLSMTNSNICEQRTRNCV